MSYYPAPYRDPKERNKLFEHLSAKQRDIISCVVCRDVLFEPHQTCGYRFCKTCLHKYKGICPGCLLTIDKFHEIYFDKAIEKEIFELEISPTYMSCTHKIKLKDLNNHIDGRCMNMCSCESDHDDSCPRMIIDCPMKPVGCVKRLSRDEMDDHMRDHVHYHESLMMGELVTMKRENERIKEKYLERNNRLNKENKELKIEVAKRNAEINTLKMTLVTMENKLRRLTKISKPSCSHKYKFPDINNRVSMARRINFPFVASLPDVTVLPGYTMSFKLNLDNTHTTLSLTITVKRSMTGGHVPGLLKVLGVKWSKYVTSDDLGNWFYLPRLSPGCMSKVGELTMNIDEVQRRCNLKNELCFVLEILDEPVRESGS